MDFGFEQSHNLKWVTFDGILTYQRIRDMETAMLAHPAHKEGMHFFADVSGVSGIDIPFSSMMSVCALVEENLACATLQPGVAIKVGNDLQYGMARMFQSLLQTRGSLDVQIFDAARDALDWLGCADVDWPLRRH